MQLTLKTYKQSYARDIFIAFIRLWMFNFFMFVNCLCIFARTWLTQFDLTRLEHRIIFLKLNECSEITHDDEVEDIELLRSKKLSVYDSLGSRTQHSYVYYVYL